MTIKSRLRRFWRQNKECCGMWAMFIQLLALALPPYCISELFYLLLAAAFSVVWILERHIFFLRRLIHIREYQHERFHRFMMNSASEVFEDQKKLHCQYFCKIWCDLDEKECLAINDECEAHEKFVKMVNGEKVE